LLIANGAFFLTVEKESDQEQVTRDEFNNWFAHPSPDGKWLVFLSYGKDVRGHPANKPVKLRLMPAAGGPVEDLVSLFGGQGSINVPSWSPDSKNVAFVSYELLKKGPVTVPAGCGKTERPARCFRARKL
jgi:Tol biopolymer transport system component